MTAHPSGRMPVEMAFAAKLRRAMSRHGLTAPATASLASVTVGVVRDAVRGRHLPIVATAAALAEALDSPELVSMVVEARTRACVTCGAAYVRDRSQNRRVHCSQRCANTAHARRVRASQAMTVAARLRLSESRLRQHREAVGAMCRSCALEGTCWDEGCDLRPVSPLPLVRVNGLRRPA